MMIHKKDRKISFIIAVFTFLTLIFCCSHICEAAGTKLAWDESPESNVEGYYVYYGTESENYTDSVQVVGRTTTSYLIADFNFTPNQTYYIVITAYTDTGEESEYSNEIVYEEIKPETVTGLQSTTHSIGECSSNPEITAQWTAAVDTGGSGLDGYSIIWDTESNTLPDTTKDIEDVTTVTSPSLSDGTYYFHIRSVDNALNWSNTAEHLGPFCIDTSPPNVAPTASAGANPTSGTAPLAVSFTGSGSDSDGTIVSYSWNFGDGGTSTQQNPAHTYSSAGNYTATLTVTDDDEATGSDTVAISVASPPDTIDPTVTITSPTSGDTYSTEVNSISLGGNSSDNIGVTSVTWSNNRGGSATASGTDNWTISNISLQEGDNVITVTALDAAGNTGTDTLTVTYTLPSGTYTEVFGDATDSDYPGTLEDTFINLNEENSFDSEYLNTYTWPQDTVANAIIMKCDLSAIPSSAIIQSATLYLYLISSGGDNLYDLTVHKIINYNPEISACTGYTYDGTNSWTPTGEDIPLAQADIASAEDTKSIDKTYGYKSWSVTSMVQDWVSNQGLNYGMLVNSDPVASSDSNRFFSATEYENSDQRPRLVVTYSVGEDVTPPADVSAFTATSGDSQVTLSWTNPADSDFAGTMIRYRTDSTYPNDYNDGTLVCDRTAAPGAEDSFTHTELQNGTSYYYSAFTYDEVPNYSEAAHGSATPVAIAPPNVPPTAAAGASPSSGKAPLAVSFTGSGSDSDGTIASYSWSFGDGGTSTQQNPAHTYNSAGNYTATLTVTDDDGATGSDTVAISVAAPNVSPTASAGASPTSGEAPLTVSFTGSGSDTDGTIVSYSWNFGDGGTSGSQNPSHTYSSAGNYTATLTVTDDDGATGSDTVAISVSAPNVSPTASAGASPTSGTVPLTVNFTGSGSDTDGTIASYSWSFGDGGTSSSQNPAHTYNSAGNYTATLTVTDNDGATGSDTVAISVAAPNVPPTASAGASPTSGEAPLAVSFTGSGSDTDGTISSYSWSFGDGGTSSSQNPAHTYNSAGNYTATLTVTDNDGATGSDTVAISVASANVPPTAAAGASPSSGKAPLAVSFTGSGSDSDGTIVSYSWSFGDGGTSTLQNPAHTYNSAGNYTATLTVTDDDGATGSDTVAISVSSANVPPTALFDADPTIGEAPLTVQFTDTSTDSDGEIVSWNWDFGDGDTSTAQNPGHTYNSAGTYTPTLTVTDDDDATDSASTTISVSSGETISLYIEAESGTLDLPMVIGDNPDPQPSDGAYIHAPAGSGDTTNPITEAVYNIDIPYDGNYYLWLRMHGPASDNDAMYIGFNGDFDMVYPAQWEKYEWVRVETVDTTEIFTHHLSAGTNQINIGHGEEAARVDMIFVTNDPDRIPYALIIRR